MSTLEAAALANAVGAMPVVWYHGFTKILGAVHS
jgi:hypothetical protein